MKVKCLSNKCKNLSQKFLNDGWSQTAILELEINQEYIIYSITFLKNNLCLFLLTDQFLKPFWYPDELFQIIDNKLSSLWYFVKCNDDDRMLGIWGYNEIINIENHSDNLMEREDKDLEVFYKRKKEMDMEFPDLSIKIIGKTIDSKTLKCPICDNMWESNSIFGMVECPKCNNIMHNPRYEKIIE